MAGRQDGNDGRGQGHGVLDVRRWPARVVEATVGNVGLFVLVAVGGWLTARSWPTSWWLWWALLAVVVVAAVVLGVLLWRRRRRSWPRPAAWKEALAGLVLVVALCAMTLVIVTYQEIDDCGRPVDGTVLDVVVVWEDAELADFCSVVSQYGGRVEVVSVGEDIGAALDRSTGSPPDVVVIPQPSLVRSYATDGRLCPIDDSVTARFPERWNDFSTASRADSAPEHIYGAIVKGALKSVLWYHPDLLVDQVPQDWTWDDLKTWVSRYDDQGSGTAALTLPAGDRWPLTDWFESQLAGTDPVLYEALSSDEGVKDWQVPEVRGPMTEVLAEMATLWKELAAFGDHPEDVEELRWEQMPQVLYDREAVVMFGPSFLAGPIEALSGNFGLVPVGFPAMDEGRPFVVGGDLAVVPRPPGGCGDATRGSDFVDFLTGTVAQRRWTNVDPGFLSPSVNSPFYTSDSEEPPRVPNADDNVRVYLTYLLREPPGEELHFDLSDDRFAHADGGDPRGTWDIFFDFYTDVTGGEALTGCAVDRVLFRLEAEYEGDTATDIPCVPEEDDG